MQKVIVAVVVFAAGAFFALKFMLHTDVEDGVDAAILALSPYAEISYDGVSSTLSGELTVDGIRGRVHGYQDGFVIDRIGIDTPSFFSLLKFGDVQELMTSGNDALPDYFGIILEGVQIPANADFAEDLHQASLAEINAGDGADPAAECTGRFGHSPRALTAMGYDQVVFSMRASFRRQSGSYTLAIDSDAVDMWQFDADLTLDGDMLRDLTKGMNYRPRMRDLRLEFTDLSMNQRIRDYCRRQGVSEEQALAAQLATFESRGRDMGIIFDQYVLDPYREFLEAGSSIVFTARPTEPVALSQIGLYKPEDVPALLQLSAEAR